MGILAEGERCVSTTNRNFIGRIGDTLTVKFILRVLKLYASAVTGKITAPEEVIVKNKLHNLKLILS